MDNIHVINLAAYEAPIIKESKKNDWVEYGENNMHFQWLMDRYINSTTNSAVINNIARLVYGKGLKALDAGSKPSEYAQMMAIFEKDDIRKMALDFKMLGQFAIQILYTKDHKKIAKGMHVPVHLLRAEKCNDDGDIMAYYYSDNWEEVKKYTPMRYAAFGTSNDEIEILYVKPYSVGMKYYSYPDYQGALPYTVLEQETSDYMINLVKSSFSPSTILNFNNGVPSEEQQQQIKNDIMNKLTGPQGDKLVVSFNTSKETAATIENMPVEQAPELYRYLSEECVRKILIGHNVTSPLLFGIATSTGFSANADELKNSAILFNNMVITPLQEVMIDAFDKVLAFNGIALKLYFETLNPLDASGGLTTTDEATKVTDAINMMSPIVANKVLESMLPDEIRSLVGLKPTLQPVQMKKEDVSDEELADVLSNLGGELNDEDEWELVDSREYSDTNESTEEWATKMIKPKQTTLQKLSGFIKSNPNGFSYLDKSVYKVRYRYSERYNKQNTRDFCKQMMRRTANGVVYRLEDIDQASRAGINKELGHKGEGYDLFKFKGGVNCGHFWTENLYRLKKNTDGTYRPDKALSSSEKVATIPKSYMPNPRGSGDANTPPIDMPNNGHHPKYNK